MRRLPELLAPAGSPEALQAALSAGADAVYLSGRRFGARKFAANFDDPALAQAIDCAHLAGAKVYVTVNTLIRENELADVASYLLRLYEMGADAVLLQDPGVALLARRMVPELERHASTQMTIHNREGALWAARAGFKRVVLAREVGLDEIKEMGPDTVAQGIGLEVFVHGALCYSYSGQCLLSSAIGGRSGNRGMCAQPCRKPYVLLRGKKDEFGRPAGLAAQPLKERFLISTRDLCTYRHLDEIVRSPVQSLKIEGRMKSPEYVAIVTGIYRKALQAIARGRWSPSPEEERDLALAFNRDFTEGHLLGARDVMGREASDNRGVFIGSVAAFDAGRGEAAIRLSGPLSPEKGDGLVFQAPGQEMGLVVQKAVFRDGLLRLKTPERVRPGSRVYLTGSAALAKKAEGIIASPRACIPLDIAITWEEGVPLLEARLEGGQSILMKAAFKMERAKNQPTTRQQIEAQMRRTGGTPFVVGKIAMDYGEDLFAPLGALNQLRRDLLQKVQEALLEKRRPPKEKVERARGICKEMGLPACASGSASDANSVSAACTAVSTTPIASATPASPAPGRQRSAPTLAVYADILETVRGAVEAGCRRIYFEPILGEEKEKAERARKLMAEAKSICGKAELFWKWPRITRAGFLKFARPLLAEIKADGIMVENVGGAEAVLAARPGMRLYGAPGLNVCNHLTVEALAPPFALLTLSPELSAGQLENAAAAARLLPDAPCLELMVQGNLEVMVAEDCIPCLAKGKYDATEFWGLQDMRRIFPLCQDDEGRTHIFNSAETCLLDQMPRLFQIGLDGLAIDARGRTEKYASQMAQIYAKAIDLTAKAVESLPEELEKLKEELRPLALGGITHGHFIKGLKDELS